MGGWSDKPPDGDRRRSLGFLVRPDDTVFPVEKLFDAVLSALELASTGVDQPEAAFELGHRFLEPELAGFQAIDMLEPWRL